MTFNYLQLNRATNCPSWPGGVARSAGVVVQALDRMLTEPDSRKTAGALGREIRVDGAIEISSGFTGVLIWQISDLSHGN